MTFPWNVYLAAVLSAAAVSALCLPVWRKWCVRIGLVDDPGHRKIHTQPVPLAGGLAVATGLIAPTLLGALVLWSLGGAHPFRLDLRDSSPGNLVSALDSHSEFLLRYGLNRRVLELAGILIGALGMLTLGVLDDKHELSPQPKFIGQFLIAFLVASAGVRITLFVSSPVFHYAITILWILTVVNAFNFMDNMNGLCTGLGAIGAWYFATIAATQGQYLVAIIAFLTFGSLVGFLPYNFPRGRAFLGDAGSHLVGYLLAVLAILPHFYTAHHPRHWAVLIPLLVLAVPLGDLVWVVIIRWRKGQPFYVGDTNHLSHRLVRQGIKPTDSVILIWIIAAVIGGLVYFWV
ncbi:MAG TPA: MraY family glycosyltransferase [Patescibacteria group bacterium]|nr:MraY family glycosyltransferase [Patescibacteria group bacterium]